jgi:hypothetical protein
MFDLLQAVGDIGDCRKSGNKIEVEDMGWGRRQTGPKARSTASLSTSQSPD